MVWHHKGRDWDTPEYKKWRWDVKKRDKYKCRFPNCQSTKCRLQVHHIRKWASNLTLRFLVDNGITLCKRHHDLIKGKEDSYAPLFIQIVNRDKNKL